MLGNWQQLQRLVTAFPQEQLSCLEYGCTKQDGLVLSGFLFLQENRSHCPSHPYHVSLVSTPDCLGLVGPVVQFLLPAPFLYFFFFFGCCCCLAWVVTVTGFFLLSTAPLPQTLFLPLEACHGWKLEIKPQLNSQALTLTVISNHRLILLLDLTNGS